jgi:predicted amidophosphoribosyltransferase
MNLNPQRVAGSWDVGFTLDRHVQSSEYLGENEYGHPQFETTRTELGELLFRLKYRSDQAAVAPIAQAAADFVKKWNPRVDVIVPVPPSKARQIQPLVQITEKVGGLLHLPVETTSVRKVKAMPELKNLGHSDRVDAVAGAHAVDHQAFVGRRVLLLDDLYQTGATLNAIGRLLKEPGGASAVFALALTRARS